MTSTTRSSGESISARTLGWLGDNNVGFEVDFGYSPNFFQDTAGDADFDFGDSNVTTLMGNVLVGASGGAGRAALRVPAASA